MNEQEPQLPATNSLYIDVLKELRYGDFFDALAQAEAQMDLYNDAQTRADHIEVLNELFGLEYENGSCRVLGDSYQMKEDGYLSAGSSFFYREGVIYNGITIEVIDDEERVLLSCWDPETEVEYFVLPESLIQLEIRESATTEGINDILMRHVESTNRLVSSGLFLAASYSDQQQKLDEIFSCIENDLNTYSNSGRIEIDCSGYYAISDVDVVASLKEVYMEQSGHSRVQPFCPSGTVVGVSILEQLDASEFDRMFDTTPSPYRNTDEFVLSNGVPCVIVRDDLIRMTYLIQLDSVRDVICIEAPSPDEYS